MKILVITNLYPPHHIGGYEIRCRNVCERLRQRGHDIRILTSDHHVDGQVATDEPHVHRTLRLQGMYGNPWRSFLKLIPLEWHNHRQLIESIESFQPEVIHIWNLGGISKSLLTRIESSGIPTVYDVSDHWIARSLRADVWMKWWNHPTTGPARIAAWVCNAIGIRAAVSPMIPTTSWESLKFPNAYFCSAAMRDATAAKGWPVEHAAIIHCGVDTSAFHPRPASARFEKLLWVGRFSADKDPRTAVRALAASNLRHLTLDLYGHGSDAEIKELQHEIETSGLADRVALKQASADRMPEIYPQYDALLFTSNWGEPFALTPLEAMASGLPVISTLDGGQRELARDRENCLVAAAGDPSSFAQQIAILNTSPELRESIAANALTEVRSRFDIDAITGQIEDHLRASLTA